MQSHADRGVMQQAVCVGSLSAMLDRLADDFREEAARAMTRRGFFSAALPGGSVAIHGFPVLAALALDWDSVHFFWVDERAVSPSDPESNYALARARWLDPAHVPMGSIHRMPADASDLAAAAVTYGEELTRVLGAPARLDFVLLGVGPDGHVASLFPGHSVLEEARRLVALVEDAPKPPSRRLTLTLPMLTRAERVVFLAFGESKARTMQEAIEQPDSSLPVALILRRTARPLVLLDEAAASRMTSRRR